MTAPRVIVKLIRRVQRRSAWCAAIAELPKTLWVTAIVIALLLPVHFFYLPVDVWSTTLAAILISSLWFIRTFAVNLPSRDHAACIADTWYDGKSLITTAFDLAKRNSREPFAKLVTAKAKQNAKIWLAQPQRMKSPGIGWRIWLPATIAATGLIFLFIPGQIPGQISGGDAPGSISNLSATAGASLSPDAITNSESRGQQVDSTATASNQSAEPNADQAMGQLRPLPTTDPPDPSAIDTAKTAPDAFQDTPSAAIAGSGDLPGADGDDTAFVDTGVVLPVSYEIQFPATGNRSPGSVTARTNINGLTVRYGPAQAQYAAAYFRELDRQGRGDE